MKISVIIPAYNQGKYLVRAIESVINQNIKEYEIIIVNDGSTDNTGEICEEYAKKYDRIKYIKQENKGLGGARNTGLNSAIGEYILFLDSDDAFVPNCFAGLYLFAKSKNADIVYFDEIIADSNLNKQYIARTYSEMNVEIDKIKALKQCMNPAHVWSRMYKRSTISSYKFVSMWYEDMEFLPQVILNAKNIFYYKIPLLYYRQHSEGITHKNKDERNKDVIKAWNKAISLCSDVSDEEKNAIYDAVKNSIKNFIYFRPYYSDNYLNFYNDVIAAMNEEKSNVKVDLENCIFFYQAKFYENKQLVSFLESLVNLYNCGGVFIFGDNKYISNDLSDSKLILKKDNDAIICTEMQVAKKSIVIKSILDFFMNINLVSLKGDIKDIDTQKIVLESFLDNNCIIEMRK